LVKSETIGGGDGRGAEGAVAPPHLQTRGRANGIKSPPPFRGLNGMMPACTEKTTTKNA